MNTRAAFETICAAVKEHPTRRLVGRGIDDEHFGNFFVTFIEDGQERSVVNDRGFVFVTVDLTGAGDAIASVPSLYDADAESLLSKLGL